MEILKIKKELLNSQKVDFLARLLNEDKMTTTGRLVYLTHANESNEGPYSEEELSIIAQVDFDKAIGECLVKTGHARILKDGFYLNLAEVVKADKKAKWTPSSEDYKAIVDYWNDSICPVIKRPKVTAITVERKKYMNRMFNQFGADSDKWFTALNQILKTDWILAGRVTFTFETIFRNSNFLKFYEAAQAMPTEEEFAESLLKTMPKMQPVLSDEELEGRF